MKVSYPPGLPKQAPAARAGEALALGMREDVKGDKSIPRSEGQVNYPTRYCIGFLDGKAVYAPLHMPSRGLAIEEDWSYLRAMREEEVLRFMAQIQSDFTSYLIAAQADEIARRQSEEWYSEIGHGKAYGWPHVPEVA